MRFGLFYEFQLPRPWDDARYEAAGVDRLLLYSQEFLERDEGARKQKAERLEPYVEAVLARKAAAVPRARREAKR